MVQIESKSGVDNVEKIAPFCFDPLDPDQEYMEEVVSWIHHRLVRRLARPDPMAELFSRTVAIDTIVSVEGP